MQYQYLSQFFRGENGAYSNFKEVMAKSLKSKFCKLSGICLKDLRLKQLILEFLADLSSFHDFQTNGLPKLEQLTQKLGMVEKEECHRVVVEIACFVFGFLPFYLKVSCAKNIKTIEALQPIVYNMTRDAIDDEIRYTINRIKGEKFEKKDLTVIEPTSNILESTAKESFLKGRSEGFEDQKCPKVAHSRLGHIPVRTEKVENTEARDIITLSMILKEEPIVVAPDEAFDCYDNLVTW